MDQNNNQVAVLPRRSRRLATIIPASHWISLGYSEEGAQARVNLQYDMKKYYDSNSKYGYDDAIITLIPRLNIGGYTQKRKLLHDDMMLPHWEKLAKSLNRQRTTVEQVQINQIDLPMSILDIILPAFQSMDNLRTLSISQTSLRNDGLQRLSTFLKENTRLRNLLFGGDIIDDLTAVSSFSNAIKNHPTLESVTFVALQLNSIMLRKVLQGCSRLRTLELSSSMDLNSEGIAVLAEFISSNHTTETITFYHDDISDSDTLVLASALKKNTRLKCLNLKGNTTKDNIMFNALYDPTSMDSIVESNHRCIIKYSVRDMPIVAQRLLMNRPPLKREVASINGNDYMSIKEKIRKKVVLALCGVDGGMFDISCFNDIPLHLMPRVLELIQEHASMRIASPVQLKKDALSRLFHTLRGWELPLLFENLRVSSVTKGTTGKRKRKVNGTGKRSCLG